MDILDRLLGHDTWTTHQLLLACKTLPDELLDKQFEVHAPFIHLESAISVTPRTSVCTGRAGHSLDYYKSRE
jgi:hypothetical protein